MKPICIGDIRASVPAGEAGGIADVHQDDAMTVLVKPPRTIYWESPLPGLPPVTERQHWLGMVISVEPE